MRIKPTDIDPTGGTNGQVIGLVGGIFDIIDQSGGGGGGGGASTFAAATFLHQSASGVGGGTPSTGAWTKRTLNVEQVNEISGVTLTSSAVSLPAGTYRAKAAAKFYRCARCHMRLRDTTNSVTILIASNSFSTDNDGDTEAFLEGTFTLSGTTDLELQYYADSSAGGANGLGVNSTAANGEASNFAFLTFEKVVSIAAGATITETGTSANLDDDNKGKYQRWTATGAKTLTVQPNATEAITQDAEFYIANRAASDNLTLAAGVGVTINVPSGGGLVLEPGMVATLKRVAEDVFDLIGQTVS